MSVLRNFSSLPDEALLTTTEAAQYLRLSNAWLERDRWSGKPLIPWVRISQRLVRYRLGTLRAHISANAWPSSASGQEELS